MSPAPINLRMLTFFIVSMAVNQSSMKSLNPANARTEYPALQ